MSDRLKKKQSFSRRPLPILLGLALVVVVGATWLLRGSGLFPKEVRRVILISIDTCRADYLSCYGYPHKITPNIDAVAQEGILFKNVISSIPMTLPAHCSMLTGTIPPYHGVHDNFDYKLGQSDVTLAEILRRNGFTTSAIISAFVMDSQFGLDQGFGYYNDRFEKELNTTGTNERRGEEASRLAIEWLDLHKNEEFFLFLHYFDPHTEYVPPEPFASKFADNLYAGEIAYTDYCIGQVIKKLKALRLYDATLIVITGDHGEMLGEHGEGAHSYFIYQSAIKVPLIFKLPGQRKSKEIKGLVGLVDIVPTVCSLLGIQPPAHVQGKDLFPHLTQKSVPEEERYVYTESLYATKYDANPLLGVVTDRWKYIQTTQPELYDLAEDPQESSNLIKQQPQRARILQDRLRQILERTIREDESSSKVGLDEQSQRRLESLGYLAGSVSEDFEFDQSKDDPKDLIGFHLASAKVHRLIFRKKYEEAKTICEMLLKKRPQSSRVRFFLARMAALQNDFAGAIPHLHEALKLRPRQYEVHQNLGVAFTKLGRFEEGIKHYLEALKLRPWEPNAHIHLADALTKQGKLDEAINRYNEALRLGPERPRVLNNLGSALAEQGKYDQAVKYFIRALEIAPERAETFRNLKKTLVLQGKMDEAVKHYKELLRANPHLFWAHNELAAIFYKQKNLDQAVAHLTESLRLKPDQPAMIENLVRIYFQQGKSDQALGCWKRALQLKPDWVIALNSLARIKASHKDVKVRDPEEAIRLAQRACELTGYGNPSVLDTLSAAYAAAGSFPQAIETAEKALKIAKSGGQRKLASEIQKRLELYKRGLQ